jgi:hypothetical protein
MKLIMIYHIVTVTYSILVVSESSVSGKWRDKQS